MIRQLATKALKKEAEQVYDYNKKALIYAGGIALAGIGLYASYRAVKHFMGNKEYEDDLAYLESLQEYEDNDLEYDYYENGEETSSEDKELKEKVDEFNSRRLNTENEEIVSPNELHSYIEKIKVDKDDVEVDLEFDGSEENYEKYNEE